MVTAAQLFDESRIILQGSDTLLVNRAFHVVNNGNETATCEVDFFIAGNAQRLIFVDFTNGISNSCPTHLFIEPLFFPMIVIFFSFTSQFLSPP